MNSPWPCLNLLIFCITTTKTSICYSKKTRLTPSTELKLEPSATPNRNYEVIAKVHLSLQDPSIQARAWMANQIDCLWSRTPAISRRGWGKSEPAQIIVNLLSSRFSFFLSSPFYQEEGTSYNFNSLMLQKGALDTWFDLIKRWLGNMW